MSGKRYGAGFALFILSAAVCAPFVWVIWLVCAFIYGGFAACIRLVKTGDQPWEKP